MVTVRVMKLPCLSVQSFIKIIYYVTFRSVNKNRLMLLSTPLSPLQLYYFRSEIRSKQVFIPTFDHSKPLDRFPSPRQS